MPLSGSCFWAVILPTEDVNIIPTPSFERGTTGWGTIQAGTIGTTSAFQQFGAWSGSVAPTSNGTTGARSPTFSAGNGTAYTASAYIRGANGIPYRFGVGDSNGASMVGSTTFTGGGTWHRYSFSWTEASGATRALAIKKDASADTSAFYIDGVQVEVGSLTTYLDGDADGCYWQGVPHQSSSLRSGTYRGGGSVVALEDLGLKPDDALGIGMPPLDTTDVSYALLDGGEFLQQRAAVRPFSLTCKPLFGTSQADYHVVRRTLIDALKIDLVDPQQPVRLWYTGGQGTIQIDAVLAGGFEGGERTGPMAENMAVRFIAHDPMWYATTEQGTALNGFATIGGVNAVASRDALGHWGTMAGGVAAGISLGPIAAILPVPTGTVFFGGGFTSGAGGTSTQRMAFWNGAQWGTLTGGTVDSGVNELVYTPSGSLYVGGGFSNAGGTQARFIAQWNGAWGTLTGGTVNNQINDILLASTGTVYIVGGFTQVGGTNTRFAAQWNGAWGTLVGGTVNGTINAGVLMPNGSLVVGGEMTTAGGTAAGSIAQWSPAGAWGTLAGGIGAQGPVYAVAVAPNALLYAGGSFGAAGGGSANNIAAWNGAGWNGLGSGVLLSGGGANIRTMVAAPDGQIYAAGAFGTVNGVTIPFGAAVWNGAAWVPLDFLAPTSIYINSMAIDARGVLYISIINGPIANGTAASTGDVVNTGRAVTYPVVRFRNTGGNMARVYQFINTTTGDALYFNNLFIQPQEEQVLSLIPGERSFTSTAQGNLFGRILGGSNLATWKLMPGANTLSFLADDRNVIATVIWQPRSWSADAGTVS